MRLSAASSNLRCFNNQAFPWEEFRSGCVEIPIAQLVPKDRMTVTVSYGWVKLEGRVDWVYEKKVAESAVRNLLGVKGVFNEIEITPK
jgi:BON domain